MKIAAKITIFEDGTVEISESAHTPKGKVSLSGYRLGEAIKRRDGTRNS
jgi:hypothetical protein